MALASDIITGAYREGNLIPVGTVPTAAENTEALDRLNNIIQMTFGYEMGEKLEDWPVPAPQRTAPQAANYPQLPYPQGLDGSLLGLPFNYDPTIMVYPFPPKNSRIVYGDTTTTVYFPEAPDDGSRMAMVPATGLGDGGAAGQVLTLDGNGRTIETSATKVYTAPITARQWLYRADLGDWLVIQDLALTDTIQFPREFDDLWILLLAIRLMPRNSKPVSNETAEALKSMMARFKTRYRQYQVTTFGSQDFPRSLQSYISGRWWYAIPIAMAILNCYSLVSSTLGV
jgi:hypothetical protein